MVFDVHENGLVVGELFMKKTDFDLALKLLMFFVAMCLATD